MTPEIEFSRPFRADTLGEAPRTIEIEATEGERDALARRFGLAAIDRLTATAEIRRNGDTVSATGRLGAEVVQTCIVTAEPIAASVDEPFDIVFRPQLDILPEEEIELKEDELDVIFYDGATADIGEAVAQTLSLSLDPYPRAPGAETALREAGVRSEEEAGPFGGLAGLRDMLKR